MEVPKISVLSPLVTRILGCNPGKYTLQGTNTYLIGKGKKRVLLDAGQGSREYTELLAQFVEHLGIDISTILLTHWHEDHVNGVQPLIHHPNLGSKIDQQAIFKHKLKGDDSRYPWPVKNISDGQVFNGDGFTLSAHYTPGHAEDHMVFWLEEEKALFSGDNLLGHGTAVFENLSQYMTSLKDMLHLIESNSSTPIRSYPGHGHYIEDAHAKISEYIHHRTVRENEIVEILHTYCDQKGPEASLSAGDIVKVIYKDYPQELWPAAEYGVSLHLEKLKVESRVESITTQQQNQWKIPLVLRAEAKL